jgi:electron transport complex protein RnfC
VRKVFNIPGGIHPPENKHQSTGTPIATAPIADTLIIPLSQHIGAPAKPMVEIGEKVLKGQMIAAATGFVSVPVHAPTSGTVSAIGLHPIPHASGMSGQCISIATDGADEWIEHNGVSDYTQLDKAKLLDIIRNAGIAGMGGAGFPAAVKLAGQPNKPIRTLIINGTECEPYITADDMLMRERSEQIVKGIKILAHIIAPEEILIGIEDNKPEALAIMRQAVTSEKMEVVQFPTKYPSGGEKQLIQILTNKEVPRGGLPADIGIVLQNPGTAAAIYQAVVQGKPLISRITTVTGEACENQQNYEVLIGTPMSHLLNLAGFKTAEVNRLIMGGPMMGFALQDYEVPIVKTTNCILAPSQEELPEADHEQACIRCGMCVQACPVSLLPQQLYWFSKGKELDKLKTHNLADCIECGCCSYVCPSNIPLVQYYRSSKAAIREHEADQQRAEHSKARFEAREQRLIQEQEAKEAKRKARAEAAQKAKAAKLATAELAQNEDTPTNKDDIIQAAIARSAAKKAAAKNDTVSDDPVQAAIERAKAKRVGGTVEAETAEQKIEKLEKKLATAETKFAQAKEAGSDKLAAFQAGLDKINQQLADAKSQLSEPPAKAAMVENNADGDASDAIARAQAKRAAGKVSATPEQQIEKLKNRLHKAREKLALAEADNSDKLDAFRSSVTTLEQKLASAEKALSESAEN